jgi:hypothetical protein
MNLQKATEEAKYLTQSTGIDHVVTKTNNEYYIFQKANWNGTIEKEFNYIPELRATASEDILQDTGNERPKPLSKRGQNKG